MFVENIDDIAHTIKGLMKDGDIVLMLGAGDIGSIAPTLSKALSSVSSQDSAANCVSKNEPKRKNKS